jgi:hypothetical protein
LLRYQFHSVYGPGWGTFELTEEWAREHSKKSIAKKDELTVDCSACSATLFAALAKATLSDKPSRLLPARCREAAPAGWTAASDPQFCSLAQKYVR